MNPMLVYPLAVVAIYYISHVYQISLKEREKQLRERVTFMLWQAAQTIAA